MINNNLEITHVDTQYEQCLKMYRLVKDIDKKMISIFEQTPDLIEFNKSVKETLRNLIDFKMSEIECKKSGSDVSGVVNKKIKMQFAEKIESHFQNHSKKISESETFLNNIDKIKKEIFSVSKEIEEICKGVTSFSDEEIFNELIIDISDNNAFPFLNVCVKSLSTMEEKIKKVINPYNSIINKMKELAPKTEILNKSNIISNNNNNILVEPINLLAQTDNKPLLIFKGKLKGSKAIKEANGKFCILGNGPGLNDWTKSKKIELDESTGEWTVALDLSDKKFEYKFAVIFPEWIHWENGGNRTWNPNNLNAQDIPLFNFPDSFNNLSPNESKL